MDTSRSSSTKISSHSRFSVWRFPYVFNPAAKYKFNPAAKPQYAIVMLFPKTEKLEAMRALAKLCVIDRWGADPAKWPKGLKNPFRDGDEKPNLQGYAGHYFIRATSNRPIAVVDASMQEVIEPGKVYGGAYARANVNCFAYPSVKGPDMGNRGVSFGALALQLVRDGEPFVGISSAQAVKEFDVIEGGSEDPNAYAGTESAATDPFVTK